MTSGMQTTHWVDSIRAILLLIGAAAAGLLPLTGCYQPATEHYTVSVEYLFSAEGMYDRIDIHGDTLVYTWFCDTSNRCAQGSMHQPCWNETNLTKRVIPLTIPDIDTLHAALCRSGIISHAAVSVPQPLYERSYGYFLRVTIGSRTTDLRYDSVAVLAAMPEDFRCVLETLKSLVRNKSRSAV
jgi:hypothetical protein